MTGIGIMFTHPLSYFNSHPHEEDDTDRMAQSAYPTTFQLTSSRRGWPERNSSLVQPFHISTHILTKRMTFSKLIILHPLIFQLTSSRRGWPFLLCVNVTAVYFNSHPHEEDDSTPSTFCSTASTFQLTSSRRGWRGYWRSSDFRCISTHILTKRMTTLLSLSSGKLIFQLTSSRRGWLKK